MNMSPRRVPVARSCGAVRPKALIGSARPKRLGKKCCSSGVSLAKDQAPDPLKRARPGVSS